jgi:hypothetical protein
MGPYGVKNYSRPMNSSSEKMNYEAEATHWVSAIAKAKDKYASMQPSPEKMAAPFVAVAIVAKLITFLTIAILTIIEMVIGGIYDVVKTTINKSHQRKMMRMDAAKNHKEIPQEELDFFYELKDKFGVTGKGDRNIFN